MTETITQQADFRLFLVLWNQQQNFKTPTVHLDIALWLEQRWKAGDKRLLLMAFRSAGKSTLVGLFCAWLFYRDPNLRIMVLAADLALAKKMVRNVRHILERHPLTKHLCPKKAEQWGADRFTIKREKVLRDPSMLARGIAANITGSRADVVICDDVEVPKTCDSAEKRENLRERLKEISYVLTIDGTQLYVGTPHDYFSIYADLPREEINEERPFLDGFTRLCVPILNVQGQSAWPEKYTHKDIDDLRIQSGPNKFDSQMMLKFVNILEGYLDPADLKFYDDALIYDKTIDALFIGSRQMASVSAWWDPALAARKHGDSSVVAVVFTDMGGNYYLHHLEYLRVDAHSEEDEAGQQSKQVAVIAKENYLPAISVETNGIGAMIPRILKNTLRAENSLATVVSQHSKKAKALRIMEAFDAPMAAGRLWVHESVRDTPFMAEMREWKPEKARCRDDGLDAVAGALSQSPLRIEQLYGKNARYGWARGHKPHNAKSDFLV